MYAAFEFLKPSNIKSDTFAEIKIATIEYRVLWKRLKELQIPIEMNMGGMLDGKHYPADRFWSIASEVGNKVIVGIDAHSPDSIKDMDTYGKCMEILERYKITPVNIPIVPWRNNRFLLC